MMTGANYRDMAAPEESTTDIARSGRLCIAVIGIDHYRAWNRLYNAVSDARGVLNVFTGMGFELVGTPLFDEMATGEAIHHLVVDDLAGLGREDSLVLFFAGHGHTVTRKFTGTTLVKDGYIIPVDGDRPGGRAGTWLRLESWLTEVSRIPAKHILVLLDACHSGLALGPIIKWRTRGETTGNKEPLEHLRARRSRRIITSALDDQLALDSGPVHGHSLFTGCLIEAMTGGLSAGTGQRLVTGSELGHYVQRRVADFPGSAQTPDFGALELDNRGELVMRVAADPRPEPHPESAPTWPAPAWPAPTWPAPTWPAPTWPAPTRQGTGAAPPPASAIPQHAIAPRATTAPPLAKQRSPRIGRWIGGAAMIAAGAILIGVLASAGSAGSASLLLAPDPAHRQSSVDSKPPASSNSAATKGPIMARKLVDDPPKPAAANPGRTAIEARSTAAPTTTSSCPKAMVHVPGGTFQMGSPEGSGTKDERPQHEVTLSGYCIDITEVTVAAYTSCVTGGKCTAAAEPGTGRYESLCNGTRPDRQDHPINCVTWNQAVAYCAAVGKRLPTEAEWEYAARGSDGRRYPWGNERPNETRVNACGGECRELGKRLGSTEVMYEGSDHWEATAPVRSFPAGMSPFGAFDMAGNVAEWSADWFGPYTPAESSNPHGPQTGTARVLRGGAWYEAARLWVSGVVRAPYPPTGASSILGFRCAREDKR
jgi:formylglycine-generating enzyme required for sulfatase activity